MKLQLKSIRTILTLMVSLLISTCFAMDDGNEGGHRPRVLLGEGHTDGELFMVYAGSTNYDGETNHHQAKGYITIDPCKEICPDIISWITNDNTAWDAIEKLKPRLIADMTFISTVTESPFVTVRALAALDSGGVFLVPVDIAIQGKRWSAKAHVGDCFEDAGDNVGFNDLLTNYGFLFGEYTPKFPTRAVFEEGSKIVDQQFRKSYPHIDVCCVELKPAPLVRAFWKLPDEIQIFLTTSVEPKILADYVFEYYTLGEEVRHKGPDAMAEIIVGKSEGVLALNLVINYHLHYNPGHLEQLLFFAKEEAREEERLYGDFFGPQGTTLSWPYKLQKPFEVIPAYIAITKR
ncbi:MAG: hypothetical protein K0R52_151 [Alphaproteobacteria bacterium]|nr:hypothetical protein [Alphaproteobacteria bacterium]